MVLGFRWDLGVGIIQMSLRDAVLDPLSLKELSGTSRRWQTYAGRMLYVALIGFVVWEFSRNWRRSSWLSLSDYASLGRQLFSGFFALQMVMVTLGAVTSASDMITKELRSGTLGLLASTPLTPWRIAAGKWKAAVAQTSTLMLCGAPILAICVFLGGATAWDLSYSFILTVVSAGTSAALSLWFSTVFRSGVTVTLVSLALLAAYTFLPSLVVQGAGDPLAPLLCSLHPVYAAIVAASPANGSGGLQYCWIGATLACGVTILVLLRMTATRISALSTRTPPPPVLSRTFEAMDRFYDEAGPALFRNIRFFSGDGGVWQSHVVLWKELRTRATGKLRNAVRISLLLLFVLAAMFIMGQDAVYYLICGSAIAFLLLALANGVGLFVKEKEERKWDVLLSTPLTSREIVHSKLAAGLVPILPALALLILLWAMTGWLYRIQGLDVLVMAAVILLPALLAYAVGAAASLHARSLRGAFSIAFGAQIGLQVLLPFLLHQSLPRGPVADDGDLLLACISPLPYFADIQSFVQWYGWGHSYFPSRLKESFAIYVGFYFAASALLVLHMRASFDRITGRV